MEENQNTYIWDGAVGVKIKERTNGTTGEPFHSFEFVRCYKTEESDEMKYSSTFTERNAEALGRVIEKTLRFISDASLEGNFDSEASAKHVVGKIEIAKVPAHQANN